MLSPAASDAPAHGIATPSGGRKRAADEDEIKSTRAGLKFSVSRIARRLKRGKFAPRLGASAPVELAGSLEYLCAEILELAGNAARDDSCDIIEERHIWKAIRSDEDLSHLLERLRCPEGGSPEGDPAAEGAAASGDAPADGDADEPEDDEEMEGDDVDDDTERGDDDGDTDASAPSDVARAFGELLVAVVPALSGAPGASGYLLAHAGDRATLLTLRRVNRGCRTGAAAVWRARERAARHALSTQFGYAAAHLDRATEEFGAVVVEMLAAVMRYRPGDDDDDDAIMSLREIDLPEEPVMNDRTIHEIEDAVACAPNAAAAKLNLLLALQPQIHVELSLKGGAKPPGDDDDEEWPPAITAEGLHVLELGTRGSQLAVLGMTLAWSSIYRRQMPMRWIRFLMQSNLDHDDVHEGNLEHEGDIPFWAYLLENLEDIKECAEIAAADAFVVDGTNLTEMMEMLNIACIDVTLTKLDLSGCDLCGSIIPPEIVQCTALQELDLSGCSLKGQLSIRSERLRVLLTVCSRLAGNLPRELGKLVSLTYFSVSGNEIGGELSIRSERFRFRVDMVTFFCRTIA